MGDTVNLWTDSDHVRRYLAEADTIPHRGEGERMVLDLLGPGPDRVLDLGTGDGRLMGLVRTAFPSSSGLACDFSDTMLDAAGARFENDPAVEVRRHDLNDPLDETFGTFDAVVSSFAIHHVDDDRKHALYGEILLRLRPGGCFVNLEHVSSPTTELHHRFLAELGVSPEQDDPSNRLAPVETQVRWLAELGFEQTDCHWKWRELAVFGGMAPAAPLR